MAWPNYLDYSWKRRKPLTYRTGAEPIETLVAFSSGVTADQDGRRLLPAGTILCQITSGNGVGKYGPYNKTATNGQQTIGTTYQPYVTLVGHDVSLGDLPVEGLWTQCIFNTDDVLDVNHISRANLSTLKTSFPRAEWK